MRAYVAMLATAMVIVRAGTAYAETATMNVIDASGVGKVIGTISLSDANEGLVVMPDLADLPPGESWLSCSRQSELRAWRRTGRPASGRFGSRRAL